MDVQRYNESLPKKPTGYSQAEEDRLQSRYPIDPALLGVVITAPTLFVDRFGRILAWYLPGALSQERQVSIKSLTFFPIT
jgi:hypothetical protein